MFDHYLLNRQFFKTLNDRLGFERRPASKLLAGVPGRSRKRRTSYGLSIFLFALACDQVPLSAHAEPLMEILAEAYTDNPQLLAERAKLRAVDEQVPQATANWRPTISANGVRGDGTKSTTGGTTVENSIYSGGLPSNSYGVTVTQSIFAGGRVLAQLGEAKYAVRAERANLIAVESAVLLQVATDYFNIVLAEAQLNAQIENAHGLQTQLSVTNAQFGAGEVNRVDVAQAQAAFDGAQAARYAADSNLASARESLRRDVGAYPQSVEYPSVGLIVPSNIDEIENRASTKNPNVLSAAYTLDGQREATNFAWRQALPQLSVQAIYQHQSDALFKGSNTNTAFGELLLNIPIYDGGVAASQTRASEQIEELDMRNVDQARQAAVTSALSAWKALTAVRAEKKAYDSQVAASQLSLDGTRMQQLAGKKTVFDVLTAESTLLQAKQNQIQAQHDDLLQQFTLASALGDLSARSLKLPVKEYDPDRYYEEVRNSWFWF